MPPGLPPAQKVFQTLTRFAALHPRRLPQIPPGATGVEPGPYRALSVQYLYDDLGVLAFAGATTKQVDKIGDILQQVVKHGGPGRLTDTVRGPDAHIHVVRLPAEDVQVQEFGRPDDGLLMTEAMLELAKKGVSLWAQQAFKTMAEQFPEFAEAILVDKNVTIGSDLRPFGIFHHTVNGTQRLPIDAVFTVHAEGYHMKTHVRLYAVGTGKYLGTVTFTTYAVLPNKDISKQKGMNKKFLPALQNVETVTDAADADRAQVILEATEGLWELEREIWAKRAEDEIQKEKAERRKQMKKRKKERMTEKRASKKLIQEAQSEADVELMEEELRREGY